VRVFVRISMQCAIWNTFDDAAELRFSGSGVAGSNVRSIHRGPCLTTHTGASPGWGCPFLIVGRDLRASRSVRDCSGVACRLCYYTFHSLHLSLSGCGGVVCGSPRSRRVTSTGTSQLRPGSRLGAFLVSVHQVALLVSRTCFPLSRAGFSTVSVRQSNQNPRRPPGTEAVQKPLTEENVSGTLIRRPGVSGGLAGLALGLLWQGDRLQKSSYPTSPTLQV
jgi:hypothetical protein